MADSDLLTQEQIVRLRQAQQMAQEAERLAAHRRLVAELRAEHYEGRWLKPLDLWSQGAQILVAALLIALAILLAVAAQIWWFAQQFEPRIQPSTDEIQQPQKTAFAQLLNGAGGRSTYLLPIAVQTTRTTSSTPSKGGSILHADLHPLPR